MDFRPSRPEQKEMSPILKYTLRKEAEELEELRQDAEKKMVELTRANVKKWRQIVKEYDEELAQQAGPSSDNGSLDNIKKCVPIVIFEHLASHGWFSIRFDDEIDKDVFATEKILYEETIPVLWRERKVRHILAKHSLPHNADLSPFSEFLSSGMGADVRSVDRDMRDTVLMDFTRAHEFSRLEVYVDHWFPEQIRYKTAPVFRAYNRTKKEQDATNRLLQRSNMPTIESAMQDMSIGGDSQSSAGATDTETRDPRGIDIIRRAPNRPGYAQVDGYRWGS